MSTRPCPRRVRGRAGGSRVFRMTHPLATTSYVSLTTYRKSGEPVSTPVWVAPLGDELVIISMADAWKVKRLARDPRAQLRACDVRGKVAEGAPAYDFTGRVAHDQAEIDQVRRAMNRKYLLARLGN
ncbi:MAG: PPOX class F420-dependent oxidoreductase, partial [Myxococcales bacterium]